MRAGFARIAALALVALTGPASAHHSISMIEISTPIWVKGVVTSFQVMHPHVMISMDVPGTGGPPEHWTIEGPNLMRLARMKADESFLRPGDAIEVCVFPLKKSVLSTKTHFVHGHMLIMPDGHRRYYGAYGKLDNCIRPGDSVETWVRFLSSDPLGLQGWCVGLTYASVPSVAPKTLVADINRALLEPCH